MSFPLMAGPVVENAACAGLRSREGGEYAMPLLQKKKSVRFLEPMPMEEGEGKEVGHDVGVKR